MTKFREFETSSGKKILVGKDAESNEEIAGQVGKDEFVLHTKLPGSPFVNIKSNSNAVSKEELREAAIICARYSQDWRDKQSDVKVNYFSGGDIYKTKSMKVGTFGVKGTKEITIKRREILERVLKQESTNETTKRN
jgi:predicted ribosome quality control (RQC) complex YloA/Tae2 family protein